MAVDGALAQTISASRRGACWQKGEHQPVPALAELNCQSWRPAWVCRARRCETPAHRADSQAARPAQAAQQYPAEQVLALAARLADLMPMAIFVRRALIANLINCSASMSAGFNK